MENLKTEIFWSLSDYCKSECEYCPIQLRGGPLYRETVEYVQAITKLIDAYKKAERSIRWFLDGGEPLDMDDIVTILKLCRTNGEYLHLNTNGGKLWIDWWAIEPYVDGVTLTYHYWQNPALMKYIIDTFKEKGKFIEVRVPIRPGEHFRSDIDRAIDLENACDKFYVTKQLLYNEADKIAGLFPYEIEELNKISYWNEPFEKRIPKPAADLNNPDTWSPEAREKSEFKIETWDDRYRARHNASPSFTGQMCNAGVERLHITHGGWVSGSNCGNQSLGNIWHPGWELQVAPQKCGMISCVVEYDRGITKFPLIVE